MGKTFRRSGKFDEDKKGSHSKHPKHANNTKLGGMRFVRPMYDEDQLNRSIHTDLFIDSDVEADDQMAK